MAGFPRPHAGRADLPYYGTPRSPPEPPFEDDLSDLRTPTNYPEVHPCGPFGDTHEFLARFEDDLSGTI